MTNPDPAAAVERFEARLEAHTQMIYRLENDSEAILAMWQDEIKPLLLEGQPPTPVLFGSPCTGQIEQGTNIWGGAWFDATGYGTHYETKPGVWAYHTGCDLNLPNYADVNALVYSTADGQIVFSGTVAGWQGQVLVIAHPLVDGKPIWSRYAHIKEAAPLGSVKRGQQVGRIADYTPAGAKGDHLHFDVARIDLGAKPGDWPGDDLGRVIRDYINPVNLLGGVK